MKYVYENDKHVIIQEGRECPYLAVAEPELVEYRLVYMKHAYCVRTDVEDWLVENIGDEGVAWDFEYIPMFRGFARFYFNNKEDAMRFKLTFSNEPLKS